MLSKHQDSILPKEPEDNTKKIFILSEPQHLKKIKIHQYLWQILPVLMFLSAFFLFNFPDMYYPAIVMGGLATGVFIFIGASYRYKHRIPVPSENTFVSPIQGRMRYIRSNDELTAINIGRIFLDLVEIRSPHPSAKIVDKELQVSTAHGPIRFNFNNLRISWFENPSFERGQVIGMVMGHSSCTIFVPAALFAAAEDKQVIPKAGQTIEICEPLFILEDPPAPEPEAEPEAPVRLAAENPATGTKTESEPERRSILVEDNPKPEPERRSILVEEIRSIDDEPDE